MAYLLGSSILIQNTLSTNCPEMNWRSNNWHPEPACQGVYAACIRARRFDHVVMAHGMYQVRYHLSKHLLSAVHSTCQTLVISMMAPLAHLTTNEALTVPPIIRIFGYRHMPKFIFT